MIASRKPGETVKLDVLRDGNTMKIDVKLANREADSSGRPSEPPPDGDQPDPSSGEGLGITVQAIPPAARRQLNMAPDGPGVMIVAVDPESDAAEEGLVPRAVITSIDDKPVSSLSEWNRLVRALKPGETVKVDVELGDNTEIVFLSVPQPKSK